MISYDLFLNVFLTAMFIWPLRRSNVMSHKIRSIATRTLYGACVSLTTSAANIVVLLARKGEEYGWVCLASCVTDVAINAMAINWVTSYSYPQQTVTVDRFSIPTIDVGPLTITQTDCENGKEQDHRASTTLECMTQSRLPSHVLESMYDYIPRDQRPKCQFDESPPTSKGWFSRLRDMLRPARDSERSTSMGAQSTNGGRLRDMTRSNPGLGTERSQLQSQVWISRSVRSVEIQTCRSPRVLSPERSESRKQSKPPGRGKKYHYRRASDCTDYGGMTRPLDGVQK